MPAVAIAAAAVVMYGKIDLAMTTLLFFGPADKPVGCRCHRAVSVDERRHRQQGLGC
jgi:hypothetical protein